MLLNIFTSVTQSYEENISPLLLKQYSLTVIDCIIVKSIVVTHIVVHTHHDDSELLSQLNQTATVPALKFRHYETTTFDPLVFKFLIRGANQMVFLDELISLR